MAWRVGNHPQTTRLYGTAGRRRCMAVLVMTRPDDTTCSTAVSARHAKMADGNARCMWRRSGITSCNGGALNDALLRVARATTSCGRHRRRQPTSAGSGGWDTILRLRHRARIGLSSTTRHRDRKPRHGSTMTVLNDPSFRAQPRRISGPARRQRSPSKVQITGDSRFDSLVRSGW